MVPGSLTHSWRGSCRSYFNEEPFLRALLQLHSAAVEMRRRDFLAGNWAAHILLASKLRPAYRQADAAGQLFVEAIARH